MFFTGRNGVRKTFLYIFPENTITHIIKSANGVCVFMFPAQRIYSMLLYKKRNIKMYFKKQTKKTNKNICPFLFYVVYQATSHRIASANLQQEIFSHMVGHCYLAIRAVCNLSCSRWWPFIRN